MSCAGCTINDKDGTPVGCRNNGNCGSGGCNKLNTYDWLTTMEIKDINDFDLVEVSFKNGSRKGFYINQPFTRAITGDMVVVEAATGLDVGRVSLSGELVLLQMKKKKIKEDSVLHKVIRRANQRDLEKLQEARDLEKSTMIRARAISRMLDLEMKIGDVEYQGDKRKATFYYTADGRVDFRELIRHFAKEFRVKIEMRQIGARQESARIGGLGSCGRELCCSTWLSDFKSVSTAAARYQNLAINQAKLSGQCGRLKCCLNYELDTYMEALEQFPENAEKLKTQAGTATLVKTDIFKGIMYYAYVQEGGRIGKFYPLSLDRVKTIKAMNMEGETPLDLIDLHSFMDTEEAPELDFESVNDVIELPMEEKRSRRRNRNRKSGNRRGGNGQRSDKKSDKKPENRTEKRPPKGRSKPAKKNTNKDNKNAPKASTEKKEGGNNKAGGDKNQKSGRKRPQNKRNNKNRGKGPQNKK